MRAGEGRADTGGDRIIVGAFLHFKGVCVDVTVGGEAEDRGVRDYLLRCGAGFPVQLSGVVQYFLVGVAGRCCVGIVAGGVAERRTAFAVGEKEKSQLAEIRRGIFLPVDHRHGIADLLPGLQGPGGSAAVTPGHLEQWQENRGLPGNGPRGHGEFL